MSPDYSWLIYLWNLDIAKKYQLSTPELRVLVLGMPNVGKSSLLNHLRKYGIQGGCVMVSICMEVNLTSYSSNRLSSPDFPPTWDDPGDVYEAQAEP
jgi:hypothetical protein